MGLQLQTAYSFGVGGENESNIVFNELFQLRDVERIWIFDEID